MKATVDNTFKLSDFIKHKINKTKKIQKKLITHSNNIFFMAVHGQCFSKSLKLVLPRC